MTARLQEQKEHENLNQRGLNLRSFLTACLFSVCLASLSSVCICLQTLLACIHDLLHVPLTGFAMPLMITAFFLFSLSLLAIELLAILGLYAIGKHVETDVENVLQTFLFCTTWVIKPRHVPETLLWISGMAESLENHEKPEKPKMTERFEAWKMRYERETPFANVWVVPKPAPKE